MAKNNVQRPRRYEAFNHAGSICLGVLQLLGGLAVIGLGAASYRIIGELEYHGLPVWSGCLFFFTAVVGFVAARKTMCGIVTFLVTCVIATVAAAALIVLYARLLSLGSRYYYCDQRHLLTLQCTHYTSRSSLMIVEACALGMFALEFTTGAVGLGLCLCGICRSGLSRTAATPTHSPVQTSTPGGNSHGVAGIAADPTARRNSSGVDQEFQMSTDLFQHEATVPTAPPEHLVAEEQLHGNYGV